MRIRILAGALLAAGALGIGSPAAGEVHKGVRAGASVGELRSTPVLQGARVDKTPQPGVTGGSYLTIGLGRWLTVQPEIAIAQTGAMLDLEDEDTGAWFMERRLKLTYLQLPVLVRATPLPDAALSPYVGAGMFVGLLVQGNVEEKSGSDIHSTRNVTEQTSTWDAGFVGALGLALPTSSGQLEIEARYVWGGPRVSEEFDSGNGTYVLTLGYLWD